MLLIDYFEQSARNRPNHPFVHYVDDDPAQDLVLSYQAADIEASACATRLRDLGVGRGTVVGLLMENSPQWLVWYFACQKIGAICVGLNPQLTLGELEQSLRCLGTGHLVYSADCAAEAQEVARRVPQLQVLFGLAKGAEAVHRGRDAELSVTDGLSAIFTSGTTGSAPKAALQTHAAVVAAIGSYIRHLRLGSQDRIMLVTPLSHSAALNWGVSLAVMSGSTLVLARKFSASRFWEQADRGRPSVLWTMGTILFILHAQPPSAVEARASQHLQFIFGAGSATRWRQLTERWQRPVIDGYGMTETFGTLTDVDCHGLGGSHACIGRPVAGVDMRIVDPHSGVECAAREIGEIVTRFGQGFAGYLGNFVAFTEAVREGWFHTGDLAYKDEEGRYFFVDRLKAIIRRGGENISSIEVEECLARHPDVLEAIVLPQPDDILGETVLAALVPRDPQRTFTIEEVRTFCEGRLARFKWPEHVRTIAPSIVPRTGAGKVRKSLLARSLSDAR
ncbi:class I adenylate-forming enzyme family protein [Caenimonas soli]|uniref:class I adenylate-forming enzyme family protein n=1 Tax=Caenimonas soli TaxID=2735555 RepID=UPI0015537A9E|nr:class I adenylate-forming enzyme family protein [Caenimonas soli]NPC57913.1 acyl--CoA ligase [Caenimonas soli]